MNTRGLSIPSLAINGTMTVIVILLSPFLFELLGVADLSGPEGFFAKLIPFVMLWTALRTTVYLGVGQ